MTPKRAISIVCRICKGGQDCSNEDCALNQMGKHIEKIKYYCFECAPDHKVDDCNGRIIGSQARMYVELGSEPGPVGRYGKTAICPLFAYRYGKNPKLTRKLSDEQKKDLVERGRGYRFPSKVDTDTPKG